MADPYEHLEPDLAMAQSFHDILAPGAAVTYQTYGDPQHLKEDLRLRKVRHGTLQEWQEELIALNRAGAAIAMMVSRGDGICHEGARTCRTVRNEVEARAVFLDLDGAPLNPVLRLPIRPDIVVESSPRRYHVYWKVSDCSLEQFRYYQLRLATKFGGDKSAAGRAKVMRIPGFYHLKGDPFMSRIVEAEAL